MLADDATFAVGAARRWTARIRGWYVVDLGVRIASNFVCVNKMCENGERTNRLGNPKRLTYHRRLTALYQRIAGVPLGAAAIRLVA